MFHVHALLAAYCPGPSVKLPAALDNVTVPVQACVGSIGAAPGDGVTSKKPAGATLGVADELYVASKPAPFTDPSDVKMTVS